MTDLDKKLQEIAMKDWQRFTSMVGDRAIRDAKACLLRANGASFGQIGQRLDLPKQNVRYACMKCTIADSFESGEN